MRTRVYLADTAALEDAALYARLYSAMPPYRKEKIDALRFDRDKRLSLGAGAALQKALSDLGEPMLRVAFGEHGKPYFPDRPDLQYNLSHSGTRVLCALSDAPIGCDVEKIASAQMRVAKRFFSPKETALLEAQEDPAAQKALFCRIWTLKESFMKATGRGLSLPMDSFSVCPAGETVILEQSLDEAPYAFYEWDFSDGFRYACCRRGAAQDEPPALIRTAFSE